MLKKIQNNLFFKLLSLIVALIIWVLIINVNDPMENKTIKNIKISTINTGILQSKDKKFTLSNNGLVNIQIYGRKTLVSNLTEEDFVATADMSKLSITNTVEVNIKPIHDMDIVIYNNSRLVNVSIDNVIETPFPVTIKSTGVPQEGMAVGSLTSTPKEITIRGAESMLHKIKEVVGTIDVQGARQDVTEEVGLKIFDYDGNEINPDSVSLKLTKVSAKAGIYRIKTVPIVITDVPKPADGYAVGDISINPMSINLTGPPDLLTKLNNISIPYNSEKFGDLESNTVSATINIKDYIPEGITLVDENPMVSVQIVVDKKFEKKIKISSKDISLRNRDSNLSYKINDDVEITVYGTKSTLEKIGKVSDLNPYIDVKGYDKGTSNISIELKPLFNIGYDSKTVSVEIS